VQSPQSDTDLPGGRIGECMFDGIGDQGTPNVDTDRVGNHPLFFAAIRVMRGDFP